jgi:hypothetical protein
MRNPSGHWLEGMQEASNLHVSSDQPIFEMIKGRKEGDIEGLIRIVGLRHCEMGECSFKKQKARLRTSQMMDNTEGC